MPFHALQGCSLLVVEGDSDLGAFISAVLADAGADVAGPWATASGARGSLEKRRPDAALLDVNLRDGNSYALAAELDARGVPYAFMSSSDPADVPRALHPFAFLSKPVSIIDLSHWLCRWPRRVKRPFLPLPSNDGRTAARLLNHTSRSARFRQRDACR